MTGIGRKAVLHFEKEYKFMLFPARGLCFPASFLQKRMYEYKLGGPSHYSSSLVLDFLKFINFILRAVIPDLIGIFQKWSYKGRVNYL